MWRHLKRVVKPNGAIVLTASQPFTTTLISSNMKMFKYEWIWYKSKPSGIAFKNQPMRNHENILIFAQSKTTWLPIKEERVGFTESSIKRLASGGGTYRNHGNKHYTLGKTDLKPIPKLRNPTTVRKIASVPNRLGTLHPTQKPVALMEYLIKTYTNEGDTVLDFCAGSFTTAIACINTNRDFIGIEKDEQYFKIGEKRIAKHK